MPSLKNKVIAKYSQVRQDPQRHYPAPPVYPDVSDFVLRQQAIQTVQRTRSPVSQQTETTITDRFNEIKKLVDYKAFRE